MPRHCCRQLPAGKLVHFIIFQSLESKSTLASYLAGSRLHPKLYSIPLPPILEIQILVVYFFPSLPNNLLLFNCITFLESSGHLIVLNINQVQFRISPLKIRRHVWPCVSPLPLPRHGFLSDFAREVLRARKTTPPAFPRDALVGSLDQSRGPWLLCTHLQTLQLPCASSRPCFPICVTPAECCTSARLANIRLGGATTTSPTPSPPTSQNHSSHTGRGQSNADNLGSADLGLIGLAVM